MNKPLFKFSLTTWRSLFLTALLATFVSILIDIILIFCLAQVQAIMQLSQVVFNSPIGVIIPLIAAFGLGILSVNLWEKTQPKLPLQPPILLALVICVFIGLFMKSLLPISFLLAQFSYHSFLGLTVGIFWRGRRYWRT